MWKCKYCEKEFVFNTASEKANHSRWCFENPKRKEYAKALVERSTINKKNHKFFGNQYTNGAKISDETKEKIRKKATGKKHSKETKEKLSKIALENDYQRVCKTTIIYEHIDGYEVKLDSSWEEKLAIILDKNKIRWVRPKSLKWLDKDLKEHNYFPDFYLIDYNIYLDPKNSYCMRVQKEKIEYVKENYENVFFLKESQINLIYLKQLLAPIA